MSVAELPVYGKGCGVLPLGEAAGLCVGVRLDDFRFDFRFGRAGSGKTDLALAQVAHLAVTEREGVFYLDRHGDGLERLRPYLSGVADRVVDLDLSRKSLDARHVAFNLFSMQGRDVRDLSGVADQITAGFLTSGDFPSKHHSSNAVASRVVKALLCLSAYFCDQDQPGLQPTVWTVPRLLGDEKFRAAVCGVLPESDRWFWREVFPTLPVAASAPLENVIRRLGASNAVRATFGSPVSSYHPSEAIDRSRVVLVCPGEGGGPAASLFIEAQIRAVLDRRPSEQSGWVNCFFDHVPVDSPRIADLLEASKNHHARVSVITRSPGSLAAGTLEEFASNRTGLIATESDADSAEWFSRQTDSKASVKDVMDLEAGTHLAQIKTHQNPGSPFKFVATTLKETFGELSLKERDARLARLEKIVDSQYRPNTVRETLAQIEGHDDRILRALKDDNRMVGGRLRDV